MELEESTCLTSGSTTKPQSSRHKDRTIDQWNRIEIYEPMDTLSSTKEAKICNGKKTISLISGAGKTGQPLVKE